MGEHLNINVQCISRGSPKPKNASLKVSWPWLSTRCVGTNSNTFTFCRCPVFFYCGRGLWQRGCWCGRRKRKRKGTSVVLLGNTFVVDVGSRCLGRGILPFRQASMRLCLELWGWKSPQHLRCVLGQEGAGPSRDDRDVNLDFTGSNGDLQLNQKIHIF